MKAWKRVEPTEIVQLGRRTMVGKHFVDPTGVTQEFYTMHSEHAHATAVIALTPDNQVIVARQFRPGPQRTLDDLPGGGVDVGEDLEVAAIRELREETGYVPGSVKKLGTVWRDGYVNSLHHYYLATDCVLHPDGQQLDDYEYVEPVLISIEQLFENTRNGLMTDLGAVLFAYDELQARIA